MPTWIYKSTVSAWRVFHWDDVPEDIQKADLSRFEPASERSECPPYGSTTFPDDMAQMAVCPGAVAPEAAAVRVPVLCALGERDVIGDPRGEQRAFLSTTSFDLYICPRMGHMHNFASTRELLWQRIQNWAEWVATVSSQSN
ncbi:conserved hypothetical protein [Burkholderia sp. H160]|nr:conserved hypothetical protein [Burkholderia sp. H160]